MCVCVKETNTWNNDLDIDCPGSGVFSPRLPEKKLFPEVMKERVLTPKNKRTPKILGSRNNSKNKLETLKTFPNCASQADDNRRGT